MTVFAQTYIGTSGTISISEDLTGYTHAILSVTGKESQAPGGPITSWTDATQVEAVAFAGNLQAKGIFNNVLRKDGLGVETITISNGNTKPVAAILYAFAD